MHTRLAGLEAALAAARSEARSLSEASEAWAKERQGLVEQVAGAQRAAQLAAERCIILGQQAEQVRARAGCGRLQARGWVWEGRGGGEASVCTWVGMGPPRALQCANRQHTRTPHPPRAQADAQHGRALAAERAARTAAESDAALVRKGCERRIEELEARLAAVAGGGGGGGGAGGAPGARGVGGEGEGASSSGGGPPAMAAPGYRWVARGRGFWGGRGRGREGACAWCCGGGAA